MAVYCVVNCQGPYHAILSALHPLATTQVALEPLAAWQKGATKRHNGSLSWWVCRRKRQVTFAYYATFRLSLLEVKQQGRD